MIERDNIQVEIRPLSANYERAMQEQQVAYNAVLSQLTATSTAHCAYLFIGEHASVYTLGLHGKLSNLLAETGTEGTPNLYRTNRGGDITYHGPGQLVVYLVGHLPTLRIGARQYVECLERAVMATLASYQIETSLLDDAPGVWLSAGPTRPLRKICALGIHVSRGITTHGLALNVQPQLAYFTKINPCGFTDRGVTSMQQELTHPVDLASVKDSLLQHLAYELHFTYGTKEGCDTEL